MRRTAGYEGRARTRGAEERWDEISFAPEADPLPLDLLAEYRNRWVPVGIIGAHVRRTFNDERSLELTCRVFVDGEPLMAPGSHGRFPVDLPCYFRPPSKAGVPLRSKFYAAWCMANGGLRPLRRDRMPLSVFKGRLFEGRVHIVTTSYAKDPATGRPSELPEQLWRPIISELRA